MPRAWTYERRIDDFFDRVEVVRHADGMECWEFSGKASNRGYYQFRLPDGTQPPAHRVSYEFFRGAIPEGLHLDHLCRNPCCVNPEHLEPVTIKENLNRGIHKNAVKTHCPQGHEYSEENTHYDPNGHRRCRLCQRQRNAENRLKPERQAYMKQYLKNYYEKNKKNKEN